MEQRQQIDCEAEAILPTGRLRQVPPGFIGLRATLGEILRRRRKDGGYGKQESVAAAIGIAAGTLSKIENGSVVPRLRTLDALLGVLELGWDKVAVLNAVEPQPTLATVSRRRDRLFEAGREIAEARKHAKMTFRELATISGVSVAQLWRVEAGESWGTRFFCDHPEDCSLSYEDRRIVIANPAIAKLVATFRCEFRRRDKMHEDLVVAD